ncbi:MAG TPA: hypothetical protein VFR58_15300 [Flavisolibacter sp.]|nr:hypothetical protein [Flavisolibacter sp.]
MNCTTRNLLPIKQAAMLACFLLGLICSASAQTSDTTDNTKALLEEKLTDLNSLITAKQADMKAIEQRSSLIMEKISTTTATIDSLSRKISEYTRLASKKDSVEKLIGLLNEQVDKKLAMVNALDTSIAEKEALGHSLDSVIIKKNEAIKELEKKHAEGEATLSNMQSLIAKQLDSLEVVAKLEMKGDSIWVYRESTYTKKQPADSTKPADNSGKNLFSYPKKVFETKLREINISVREGIVMEIIVKTDRGIFRNKQAVIDLLHWGTRTKGERLYREHQTYDGREAADYYIFLDDAVIYDVTRSYTEVAYGDFDIRLLPDTGQRTYLLRESTSINTYFDVAAFTDLKALGGEPNAIAQFSAEAKFITNTRNKPNSASILFNHLAFRGAVSKFDNDYKGSRLYNKDSVSRKDILQRALYQVGIKANVLRGVGSPLPRHLFSDLQLNLGFNFIGSRVFDTSLKAAAITDTAFRTITQNQVYIEPMATINRRRNFSMTLCLPLYWVSVKKSAFISNRGAEFWIRPSINLMYYGKRDPSSKIFFRYNHFINLGEPEQAFSQMQLGFSVNVTKVWDVQKN